MCTYPPCACTYGLRVGADPLFACRSSASRWPAPTRRRIAIGGKVIQTPLSFLFFNRDFHTKYTGRRQNDFNVYADPQAKVLPQTLGYPITGSYMSLVLVDVGVKVILTPPCIFCIDNR